MRLLLVILFALVAVGAAGVWALAEFGGALSGAQTEARAPLVSEPDIVAAADDAPVAVSAVNDAPALRSAPGGIETPPPAAEMTLEAVEDNADAAAAAPPPAAPPPAASPAPALAERLGAPAPRAASPPPASEAESAPPPPPPPPPPVAAIIEAPAAVGAPAAVEAPVTAQAEPATASVAAAAASGLQSQFKSRKVTYNRPPAKLALSKAIDVSLVINATEDADAGKDALQGFPGEVVERDVELSDTVSAQLTGIGFDIETQTVERQKLSGRTINRWQWRVTPTEVGTRTLILDIFGYESGSLDAEPLAAYRDEIVVEVQQLDQIINWARGVQPVFGVLAALAGAASALFAFLRFREEKKRGRTS